MYNPKNRNNPMELGIYRNRVSTLVYIVNTKKIFDEYWDTVENKKIPNPVRPDQGTGEPF